MEKLVSFENNFLQTQKELETDNPEVLACVTIDGFPEDENKSGRVVAVVYITLHGDIVVAWHDNAYSLNEHVLALIDESKMLLKNLFTENKPNGIITDADIAAIRIMITKCNNILKNASKS